MMIIDEGVETNGLVRFRFANGWTASLRACSDGTALLAAWASHDDAPRFGIMSCVGEKPAHADEVSQFLSEIASAGKVAL